MKVLFLPAGLSTHISCQKPQLGQGMLVTGDQTRGVPFLGLQQQRLTHIYTLCGCRIPLDATWHCGLKCCSLCTLLAFSAEST